MRPRSQSDLYLGKLAEYLNGRGAAPLAAEPCALVCPYGDAHVKRADINILRQSAPRHDGQQRLVVPISLQQPETVLKNLLGFVSRSHDYLLPAAAATGMPWRYLAEKIA